MRSDLLLAMLFMNTLAILQARRLGLILAVFVHQDLPVSLRPKSAVARRAAAVQLRNVYFKNY